jgi:hypothetical protein
MNKKIYKLINDTARLMAGRGVQLAPEGYVVTISEPTRSLDANAAQWPYLEAWAQGKEICINGKMVKGTSEDWKDIHTALYNGETRMAVHDGKVIMLPQRTSKMGKKEFSEWLEFLAAMTAQAGLEPLYKSEKNEANSRINNRKRA